MARAMRKIVLIDEEKCNGCGDCILACAEGAIQLVDGKARLITDSYCDGLGACLGECPQDALTIIEREAEEFDPEAVERHLESMGEPHGTGHAPAAPEDAPVSKCPSAMLKTFEPAPLAGTPSPGGAAVGISHWPIKINLIPPHAPFLKDADLLVAADCALLAYPGFQQEFLGGKAVMIGCPKFDKVSDYEEKFTAIFQKAGIRSVTVVDMEVPCCSQLVNVVKKALRRSGAQIPVEEVTIGIKGGIKSRETVRV